MSKANNEVKTKYIIEEKLGRDVSSIIYPYITPTCHSCKIKQFNFKNTKICKGCDRYTCHLCFQGHEMCRFYHKTYKNYCKRCFIHCMLNNN